MEGAPGLVGMTGFWGGLTSPLDRTAWPSPLGTPFDPPCVGDEDADLSASAAAALLAAKILWRPPPFPIPGMTLTGCAEASAVRELAGAVEAAGVAEVAGGAGAARFTGAATAGLGLSVGGTN